MAGKTLTYDNIVKMCNMADAASDGEEKKKVMKHSVFFAGQMVTDENYIVDIARSKRLLRASMTYDEAEECFPRMMDSLVMQKFFIKKENGDYLINEKYENTIAKARKIARAYRINEEEAQKEELPRAKKMYQTGTRHYHAGDYEEAAACFAKAVDIAGFRMAYFSLGQMYHEGKGVEKSDKKALCYLSNAMIRGAMIAEPMEAEILESIEE